MPARVQLRTVDGDEAEAVPRLAGARTEPAAVRALDPGAAAWRNLIEPWWKTLKALALKGRRFETVDELEAVFRGALAYWLAHHHPFTWRKQPQVQRTPVLATAATECLTQ